MRCPSLPPDPVEGIALANSPSHFQQGVSNSYSWVPQTFSGEGAALLWNDNCQAKPAYNAFREAIEAGPSTTSGPGPEVEE
ncbi:glycoside hydrolase family 10 protein [Zalerion maritima]|uniref:Glycoside hydrolase family 10 protein n=1 Tax=Zalerion maritima TaxID=339359 RepID=A0AAD5WMW3_9PEZI|nr:glycoside hydrolase family 10 protein [Zalerion maritima]